jgi:long-chain acyl-CoA synthetase
MNHATALEASASFFPNRPAVRQSGEELNYGQLNERANRIATGLLKIGILPGQHVALCLPNSADWIAAYFGILKTGAVAVTLSSMLTGDELRNLVTHSKPRFIVTTENKLRDLVPLKGPEGIEKIICPGGDLDLEALTSKGSSSFRSIDRERTDTAVIMYTGGTTGTPKGAMITHENFCFSSHFVAYNERSTENDTSICFLPFNHVFGQCHIMNATILTAGCLDLLPSFDMEQVLELMASGRVTKFFAVPTVYIRLLTVGDLEKRLGALRYCFSAASSMPKEVVLQWQERSGIRVSESYGMTEGMPVTYNHYYPERHRVGSVGQPTRGVEVQIRDAEGNRLEQGKEGEICIRGRVMMKGYLNNPQGTASAFWEGGWYRSGDIGLLDPEGYLYIVDRLKDLIITGGENVYPREVEEALHKRPEVLECAVVGLPDKEWGERVVAFVMPKPGKEIDSAQLKASLKATLSPFKVPKEYIVTNDLPKSPAGKILKRVLRDKYTEK